MAILLGTTRNDSIMGSLEDDTIFGDPYTEGAFYIPGNGAILSSGRGGNDLIHGGEGKDYIVGDAATMTGTARGGNDQLFGGPGGKFVPGTQSFEVLVGDADTLMSDFARGGNDFLDGGAGDDYLVGETFDMFDHARGGNDHLIGGTDMDWLFGDADRLMTDHTGGGNDVLDSGGGDDLLIGDGAAMSGNARCGNDLLIGGAGNDAIYGDVNADHALSDLSNVVRGRDRFVFENGSGIDSVFDFENDWDVIDLGGFLGIAGFGQVDAQSDQFGANVVIDLGAAAGGVADEDVLTLVGFTLADLGPADFVFASG